MPKFVDECRKILDYSTKKRDSEEDQSQREENNPRKRKSRFWFDEEESEEEEEISVAETEQDGPNTREEVDVRSLRKKGLKKSVAKNESLVD
jgi:hypothetical protein